MRFILIFAVLLALSACSGGTPPPEKKGPGSFITGRDEQGLSIADIMGIKNNGDGLPVNALLWRASLDIVSTIPLDDVDTFGGTIVSEWYQANEAENERIKITVFVLDKELRSDGIRVIVYLQKKSANIWQDNGTDEAFGRKLEELILTRAREIRANTVSQTK